MVSLITWSVSIDPKESVIMRLICIGIFSTKHYVLAHIREYDCACYYFSRIMRKWDYCLRKNTGADQLCSNCTADQRLCFRYTDSTISLLPKSEISSFCPFSETVHTSLRLTWSETLNVSHVAAHFMPCK